MTLVRLLQLTLTKLAKNNRGQDLIEYALMAGFVAVAAGAIMPGVSTSISTIFSQVSSVLAAIPFDPARKSWTCGAPLSYAKT